MKDYLIQVVFGTIGAFLGFYLGGLDGLMYILIVFVCIDYLTGVLKAIYTKELSSEIGFRGICRKILIFVVLGIGHMVDLFILGDATTLRSAVALFYIANEGISILENVAACDVKLPKKLIEVLSQLQDQEE